MITGLNNNAVCAKPRKLNSEVLTNARLKSNEVAFTGAVELGPLASKIEQLADSKIGQKYINYLTKDSGKNFETLKKNLPTAVGLITAACYIGVNLTSDKIPKERKPSQVIQDVIIAAFAAVTGKVIGDVATDFAIPLMDKYRQVVVDPVKKMISNGDVMLKEVEKQIPKGTQFALRKELEDGMVNQKAVGQLENIAKGIKGVAPIIGVVLAFRFIAPVVAPSIAEPIIQQLVKMGVLPDHRAEAKMIAEAKKNAKEFKYEDVNAQLAANVAAITPDVDEKIPVAGKFASVLKKN